MPTYEYQCPEGHAFDKFQFSTQFGNQLPFVGLLNSRSGKRGSSGNQNYD